MNMLSNNTSNNTSNNYFFSIPNTRHQDQSDMNFVFRYFNRIFFAAGSIPPKKAWEFNSDLIIGFLSGKNKISNKPIISNKQIISNTHQQAINKFNILPFYHIEVVKHELYTIQKRPYF
jgi:hypothetical protein